MTFGSLFTGIGGFDLGLERAGMRCAWQVEIDDKCQSVLSRHWPNVPKFKDVRHVGCDNLAAVDLICGGFPCQDLSVAGRRAGLAGERSGLFYEFMRVVAELAPRWVLIENVPGLLSSNRGRDMGAVVGTLGQLGYGWAYRVLDAQYFGVAQRRRRVFIVGCLGDTARAAAVLFEPESCKGDTPPSREEGQRVAASLTAGTAASGGVNRPGRRREDDVNLIAYQCQGTNVGEMGALRRGNGHITGGVPFVAHTLRSEGADASEDGTGRGVPLVAQTLTANYGKQPDNTRGEPTLIPSVAGSHVVRRLTPLECTRLQGFPDDWLVGLGLYDSAKYRMLGNSVAVPVVQWIARRIAFASGPSRGDR